MLKTFFRKWLKKKKNYHFLPIFVIKDPLKKFAKKSKFYFYNFLGNIDVHIQAKYHKDQMKTEGAYLIWKKADGRTDGQFGIRQAPMIMSTTELKMLAVQFKTLVCSNRKIEVAKSQVSFWDTFSLAFQFHVIITWMWCQGVLHMWGVKFKKTQASLNTFGFIQQHLNKQVNMVE